FFFSSRRRHTRFSRDWSSDVCSSDLQRFRRPFEVIDYAELMRTHVPPPEYFEIDYLIGPEAIEQRQLERLKKRAQAAYRVPFFQIGRASCRGRGEHSVGGEITSERRT